MKKEKILLTLAVLVMGAVPVQASKWRVNNTGVQADFTSASQAVNASQVAPGDTLYFEGSVWQYGDVSIGKRLVIIGPGYFLGENDSTQADKKNAYLQNIFFNSGSEGSVIKGIYLIGGLYLQSVSNILVERNYVSGLYIGSGVVKCMILRNYMNDASMSNCDHILISNNIIVSSLTVGGNGSAVVTNNVVGGQISLNNTDFRNNISLTTYANWVNLAASVNSEHNIGAGTQFGTLNGNQSGVDMNTVFTYAGSTDGKYRLKAGSPAIGAGTGGVDCGAYGGDYPYVLSGMVTGPSVWYMIMDGIDVTVKAKSH